MAKLLGIILMIIGAIGVALSFGQIRTSLSITLPSGINEIYLLIAGAVILLVGVLMMKNRTAKTGNEIPIYKGNQIVGYRKS